MVRYTTVLPVLSAKSSILYSGLLDLVETRDFSYINLLDYWFFFILTNFTDIPLRIDTFQTQVQYEFDQLRAEIATLRIALA